MLKHVNECSGKARVNKFEFGKNRGESGCNKSWDIDKKSSAETHLAFK